MKTYYKVAFECLPGLYDVHMVLAERVSDVENHYYCKYKMVIVQEATVNDLNEAKTFGLLFIEI